MDSKTVYLYVEKNDYSNFTNLLRKYNIGCIGTDCVCKEKFTLKNNRYGYKGDAILKFEVSKQWIENYGGESFTFGEKFFGFSRNRRNVEWRVLYEDEGSELAKKLAYKMIYDEEDPIPDDYYKTEKLVEYKMYEALTFTGEEYKTVRYLEEFDFEDFKEYYSGREIPIEDIIESEEFYLEPLEPEREYMDRITSILDIVDNAIIESVRYSEDETKASININLSDIRKEVKKAAEDNNLKVDITAKDGLTFKGEFGERYRVIRPSYIKGLKELYPYIYDDSKLMRITLARELRKKETKTFY